MAELTVNSNDVVVSLSGVEALAACRRQVRVPVRCLTMVHVEQAPMAGLAILRFPGVAWPGAFAFGSRRHGGCHEFVAVRAGLPAVVLEAESTLWDRVVVSHRDAVDIAAELAALLLGRGPGHRGPNNRAQHNQANGNGDRRRRSRQNGPGGLTLDMAGIGTGVAAGSGAPARAEASA